MPLPVREYNRNLNAEIERLIHQTKVVIEEADGLLHGLDEEQLNWRPDPGRWSMAQCLDHLNKTNGLLLDPLEEATRLARQQGQLHDGPYAYSFLSRLFLRMSEPPPKVRFKARGRLQPAVRLSMAEVLPTWVSQHERFIEVLKSANGIDLAGVKVSSPVSNLLKFNLGAMFWMLTVHDRRHLWQARQVRNSPQFPAALKSPLPSQTG